MSSEPLRRVLFPTPPRNHDGTQTESIYQVRPKAEVTPVNLESTPTFKQLVDHSPVPLAVAAATAAMRAAKSTQTGQPIINDMTRAAEEVLKNAEFNSIRPPRPSPRSLSSPRFSAARAALSDSASLPPLPTSTGRPSGLVDKDRSTVIRQATTSGSFVPAPIYFTTNHSAGKQGANQRKTQAGPPQNLKGVPEKRFASASFRQPGPIPSSSKKDGRNHLATPGNQPSSREKLDPLNRMFCSPCPIPAEDCVDSHIEYRGFREEAHLQCEEGTSPEETGSVRKTEKRTLSNVPPKKATQGDKENAISRMQTRSLKRTRRDSNAIKPGDKKADHSKKRRRMSEVLKLQKALETAAWTNSVAVQQQTEVIIISEDSPNRPRVDAAVRTQEKERRESDGSAKETLTGDARKVNTKERKLKLRKRGRSKPVHLKRKASIHENQELDRSREAEREDSVVTTKRRFRKDMDVERAGDGNNQATDCSRKSFLRKKGMRKEKDRKKKRLEHLAIAVSLEQKRASEKKNLRKVTKVAAQAPTATGLKSHVPLKKRVSLEQRSGKSVSSPKISNAAKSYVDTRTRNSSRKKSNPKRLDPPVEGDGMILQSAKENTTKTVQREVEKVMR